MCDGIAKWQFVKKFLRKILRGDESVQYGASLLWPGIKYIAFKDGIETAISRLNEFEAGGLISFSQKNELLDKLHEHLNTQEDK